MKGDLRRDRYTACVYAHLFIDDVRAAVERV